MASPRTQTLLPCRFQGLECERVWVSIVLSTAVGMISSLSIWSYSLFKKKKSLIYLAVSDCSCGMWDLLPWPGIKPRPPALEVQSLGHWTIWEVPEDIQSWRHWPSAFSLERFSVTDSIFLTDIGPFKLSYLGYDIVVFFRTLLILSKIWNCSCNLFLYLVIFLLCAGYVVMSPFHFCYL